MALADAWHKRSNAERKGQAEGQADGKTHNNSGVYCFFRKKH